MYVHTLMSIKNGGSESFVNMKPEQPDSRVAAEISGVFGSNVLICSWTTWALGWGFLLILARA